MASLYQISEDILRIFNDVENNEGEITDTQYDALIVKEEELKDKLKSYVQAIRVFETEEFALKKEKQSFNARQNVFKNRIERLKQAALTALQQFGDNGKNGQKRLDLGQYLLYTKNTKSIEIDESRSTILVMAVENLVRELVNSGVLYTGNDVDMQGILDVINANCKSACGDDFESFTMSDLCNLRLTIAQRASLYNLFKDGKAFELWATQPMLVTVSDTTDKSDWEKAIKDANSTNTLPPTVAKIVVNQSLSIK